MAFDPSADYVIFDGAFAVQYTPAGGTPLAVAGVTSGPLTFKQVEALGDTYMADRVYQNFSLPAPNLANNRPAQGELIVAGGDNWRILLSEFKGSNLNIRWRCACIKEV